MILVLDTNIIVEDFRFLKIDSSILLKSLKTCKITLCIPEVVYMEAINKFDEKFKSYLNKTKGSMIKLSSITGKDYQLNDKTFSNVELQTQDYKSFLDAQIKEHDILVPELPKCSHKELIERDLKRRKPFTESGKGYRDALIWHNLLNLAETYKEDIVFISNNSHDFCNSDGTLHKDLQEDIDKLNIKSEFTYLLSLHEFNKSYIIPNLPPTERSIILFEEASEEFASFQHAISDELVKWSIQHPIDSLSIDFGHWIENVSINTCANEYTFDLNVEVKEPKDHHVILEVYMEIPAELDGFIFKHDYLGIDDDSICIMNRDWNDNYMWASFSRTLSINAAIEININTGKVINFQVYSLDISDC